MIRSPCVELLSPRIQGVPPHWDGYAMMEMALGIEGLVHTTTALAAVVDPATLAPAADPAASASLADQDLASLFQMKHAAPGDVVPAKGPCCGKE